MDIDPLFGEIKELLEFRCILTVNSLIKCGQNGIPRVPPGTFGPELTLRAHY